MDENDDIDISNEDDYSDNDDEPELNIDEEENNQDNFKLVTFKNIIENINKTPKKTIPFLTKFEKARIMGVRLQQLSNGAKPRINTTGLKSMNEIVEKELIQRMIPFIIRRSLPNGTYEDWKLEEFETV